MHRALAHALLLAGLALVAKAHAQLGVPSPAVQADSHIFSAFTTRTDPRVLADDLKLGRALKGQLGSDLRSGDVYDALIARIAGWQLRTSSVPAAEAASYTALGVSGADPLVIVEADDVRLLMQYSLAGKNVTFIEQLAGAPIAAPAAPPEATPQAEARKPEPIVEKALPTEAPPPPPPAPVATPKPAPKPKPSPPVAAPKPTVIPKVAPVVTAPAAPKAAAPIKPRGECVIKPVMTEDDLWNCSGPSQASNPVVATPAPPAAAPASSAFTPQQSGQSAPRECVIKPVMTEDDLRACGSTR